MITRNDKLEIFENFKHLTAGQSIDISSGAVASWQTNTSSTGSLNATGTITWTEVNTSPQFFIQNTGEVVPGSILKNWRKHLPKGFRITKKPKVKAFFETLKTEKKKIADQPYNVDEVFEHMRETFAKSHQQALLDRLDEQKERIKKEAILFQNGFPVYLTEADIVEYAKKANVDKVVTLTWIANFARMMPPDAYKLITQTDALQVFDNYVVLHHDSEGKSELMTKAEEEEAKKDPILFGVMECSRRLYYIADWIDEFCDLTLEDLCDVIGKKPKEMLVIPYDLEET